MFSGYTAEEIIGHSILRLIPGDLRDEETRILQQIRAGERIEHYETIRLTKHGRPIPVSLTISPIKDAARQNHWRIENRPRHHRAQTGGEEARRVSEERYRTLFNLGPVAVYSCDVSGVIRDFNRRAAELWGRKPGNPGTRTSASADRTKCTVPTAHFHASPPMSHGGSTVRGKFQRRATWKSRLRGPTALVSPSSWRYSCVEE